MQLIASIVIRASRNLKVYRSRCTLAHLEKGFVSWVPLLSFFLSFLLSGISQRGASWGVAACLPVMAIAVVESHLMWDSFVCKHLF